MKWCAGFKTWCSTVLMHSMSASDDEHGKTIKLYKIIKTSEEHWKILEDFWGLSDASIHPNKNARTNLRFALSPQIQMFGICRFCRRKDAVLNPNVGAASGFLWFFVILSRKEKTWELNQIEVLADIPIDSLGSYNAFFEDAVQNDPAEAAKSSKGADYELWDSVYSVTLQWDLSPFNDPLYVWWYV